MNAAAGEPAQPALCPTCEFNIPAQFYVAGRFRVELECRKKVVSYPSATHCPYYQRAPGAD